MTVRDGIILVPLVLAILALALYPQVALHKGERAVTSAIAPAQQAQDQARAEVTP
jgi:NADH-quinone oxidoreductase subunit M